MPWIRTIPPDEATGPLKSQYDAAVRRAGKVFNIVTLSSLRPGLVQSSMSLYTSLMHAEGSLSRASKEMIAVVVSKANECFY